MLNKWDSFHDFLGALTMLTARARRPSLKDVCVYKYTNMHTYICICVCMCMQEKLTDTGTVFPDFSSALTMLTARARRPSRRAVKHVMP